MFEQFFLKVPLCPIIRFRHINFDCNEIGFTTQVGTETMNHFMRDQ